MLDYTVRDVSMWMLENSVSQILVMLGSEIQQLCYLASVNRMFHYCSAWVILCNVGEVYIFEDGLYISALEHVSMLILIKYFLVACINTTYKYCHA